MTLLFDRHHALLNDAVRAVETREFWTPFPEIPSGKIYGATAAADGQAAFDALQGKPFTLTDPQVRPLWQALRDTGIRVGVLSNTIWSRDYHRALFDRDGVLQLIDGDVYSSEIPWTKPHPEAFLAAAAAVGIEPERCVYVGDRLFEDVHGSHRAGMRAILVPHSDIPLEQQVDVEVRPDAIAHSLAEIAGIVHGWNAGVAGG